MTCRYTLVYGIRLVPEGTLVDANEARLTLKDGESAGLTLHTIDGTIPQLRRALDRSLDAFFDFLPGATEETTSGTFRRFVRMLLTPTADPTPRSSTAVVGGTATQLLPVRIGILRADPRRCRHRVQRRRPAERAGARTADDLIERERVGVGPIFVRASSIGTCRTSGGIMTWRAIASTMSSTRSSASSLA